MGDIEPSIHPRRLRLLLLRLLHPRLHRHRPPPSSPPAFSFVFASRGLVARSRQQSRLCDLPRSPRSLASSFGHGFLRRPRPSSFSDPPPLCIFLHRERIFLCTYSVHSSRLLPQHVPEPRFHLTRRVPPRTLSSRFAAGTAEPVLTRSAWQLSCPASLRPCCHCRVQ